ncbi:MAG: tRNA pseudouridine(55) synthase TruB [Parachlamydiales bacterium]
MTTEGLLLVNKTKGKNSFSLVFELRQLTGVKKIGHSGTLDPFASGVMVMLIGRSYTKKAGHFLQMDKEYEALVRLGFNTETLDSDTPETFVSDYQPSLEEIKLALKHFQGELWQTIPRYSAKKIRGKPMYKLARRGLVFETGQKKISLTTTLLDYAYPFLRLNVKCSSGTYIRQIAFDLGKILQSGAYLTELVRLKLGAFHLKDCLDQAELFTKNLKKHLIQKDF